MSPRAPRSALAAALLLAAACGPPRPGVPPEEAVATPDGGEVVVWVEAPRYLAGPVLALFGEQTGVAIRATYRDEAPEGFLDRVRSEAAAGRVDLFWGSSSLGAVALTRAGLARPLRPAGVRPIPEQYRDAGYRWTGFAVNPRVIIFNHDIVDKEKAPKSLDDLTDGPWAGKAAIARAADGAAAFQAAALFARLGDARGREFYEAIPAAGNRVVATDAEVLRLVVAGEVPWGIVALDKAICAKRQADPINIFFPDRIGPGAVVAPQVAVLLAGAPNPAQARGLYAHLLSSETAWQIGQNDCALMSLLPVTAMGVEKPEWVPVLAAVNVMPLDNDAVYDAWVRNAAFLASWGAAPSGG